MATGGKKSTKKSKNTSQKKKTNSKATSKKTSPPAANEKHTASSRAGYVLIIMMLLAAVLFLLNEYSFDNGKNGTSDPVTPEHLIYKPDKEINRNEEKKEEKDEARLENQKKKVEKNKNEQVVLKKVKIYLIDFNEKTEKTYLHPVFRTVPARAPVKSAIEELIKGPIPAEKKRGLLTAVPANIKVYNVTVSGNTAIINFNSAIEYGASGNILLNRIDQIIYTATQFENVDNIIIKVNGKLRRFLGSDGIAVSGPLHRRD
jgi:spore germination protein GerM